MFASPYVESDTFARDLNQYRVLFKLRYDSEGFGSMKNVSHLSQGAVRTMLLKFLNMGNELQRTMFLFRGI